MKNLKRIFSLALAGTMLAGMLTVGASAADFSDAEAIVNTDAVDTMVALNIITGNDDGSFAPDRVVTRAEMAKMITVALNGGIDPVLGTSTNPMYTDIAGHWAQKYIEYCSNLGIISGRGDGTFDPAGTVTGTEAAKMVLVAMGYDSTVYKFTGADWATNVNVEANNATPNKLYAEIETIDPNTGLTRDNAAQLIFNGIQDHIMERSPSLTITNGEITYGYQKMTNKTILSERYGAQTWIGTFQGNDHVINTLEDGAIRVNGKLDTAESNADSVPADFIYDFDIDNIGEQVKVIFKDGRNSRNNKPDKDDTIYGVFNTGATSVVRATMGDVRNNKNADKQINIGGTKYDLDDTVTVVTNHRGTGTVYTEAQLVGSTAGEGTNSALTEAIKAATGDAIKVVTNPANNKVQTIYITESKMGVVTAVNSTRITVGGNVIAASIKREGNDIYEGVARNDVVVVTTLYDAVGGDDAYYIVEKAESVSGTLRTYKNDESVTLGSDTYKLYKGDQLLNNVPNETTISAFDENSDNVLGEDFDLYLVNGYVGAAVQTSEEANNYSVVIAIRQNGNAGDTFDALQLQVMNAEGQKAIITVADDSVDGTDSNSPAIEKDDYQIGDIVVYTGTASDATVTIKAHPASGSKTYRSNTKAFDGAVAASNAILFAEVTGANTSAGLSGSASSIATADYKSYTLRELGDITSSFTSVVTDNDGRVLAVYMDLSTTPRGATSNKVYGIVSALNGRTTVDGKNYYSYTVSSNEETYTMYTAARNSVVAVGDLISFDVASDNIYDANSGIQKFNTGKAAYVKEYRENDGTLTFFLEVEQKSEGAAWTGVEATQNTYALDNDCTIIYVNKDRNVAGDEIGINAFDPIDHKANVALVLEQDDNDWVIVAIFVETSGEADAGTLMTQSDLVIPTRP